MHNQVWSKLLCIFAHRSICAPLHLCNPSYNFATRVICNTCNLQHVQFANMQFANMQFASRAINKTSKTNQLDGSAIWISWTDKLDRPAGQTSWTDQLDGSAGRTSWIDQLDGPAGRISWTDQFFLFEDLASSHIWRLKFQFVHCRSFRQRPCF